MRILNATCTVKSVMTDRGDMISIAPGELSRLIIATRNLVISAMKLGTPSEIGIIVSGSYEFDITKSITGAIPYLYTDEDEAKAKLLKADIDYKGNLQQKKQNIVDSIEIRKLNQAISDLEAERDKIKNELKESNDIIKSYSQTSDKRITDLEAKFKEAQDERDRLKNLLAESSDNIAALTDKKNLLNKQLGEKTAENIELNKMVSELSTQIDELKAEKAKIEETRMSLGTQEHLENEIVDLKEALKATEGQTEELNRVKSELDNKFKEIENWDNCCRGKDKEIKELKDNLKVASDTIENMKSQFNTACEKFRITKDEDGNWIQLPE